MVIGNYETLVDYVARAAAFSRQTNPENAASAPLDRCLEPVTIFAIRIAFDAESQTLSVVVSGSAKVGPIELALRISGEFPSRPQRHQVALLG